MNWHLCSLWNNIKLVECLKLALEYRVRLETIHGAICAESISSPSSLKMRAAMRHRDSSSHFSMKSRYLSSNFTTSTSLFKCSSAISFHVVDVARHGSDGIYECDSVGDKEQHSMRPNALSSTPIAFRKLATPWFGVEFVAGSVDVIFAWDWWRC